jgi:hypothetical protein
MQQYQNLLRVVRRPDFADFALALPGGLTSCGTAPPTETATVETNGSNAVDEVALMVFPGLTSTSYVPDAYHCAIVTPPGSAIQSYNASPVYQIIPLLSDYRTSEAATALNSSSALAIVAGETSCGSGLAVVKAREPSTQA